MRLVPAILASLLILAPSALAGWNALGNAEPDSAYDSSDFMWMDAPQPGERKLYFNAIQQQGNLYANPNVAALGTRIRADPMHVYTALLGAWKDCNGDGYIGFGEAGLVEYRAEILNVLGAENQCPVTKKEPTHNDGAWVTEFLPIGPNADNDVNYNRRVIYDDQAMVWGDYGRPVPNLPDGATPRDVSNCNPHVKVGNPDPNNPPDVIANPTFFFYTDGDCSPEAVAGVATDYLDAPGETLQRYHTSPDFQMTFENGNRGYLAMTALGPTTPGDAGVHALGTAGYPTRWRSPTIDLAKPYLKKPETIRGDLNPSNATFVTFYAHVGQASRAYGPLPSASVGTYGATFCPSFGPGSGQHHGWECDGAKWYGGRLPDPNVVSATSQPLPGQVYELRDTDCYDGTAKDVPVGVGLTWIADLTCASAAQPPNPY